MFKAAIVLVAFSFATLAYGWFQGNDPLLFGSIAFSALAGAVLWRVTMLDRKAHPELTRKGRKAALAAPGPAREAQRARDRKSLAELRMELSQINGDITGARDVLGAPRRAPLKPFGDTAAANLDELPELPKLPKTEPRPTRVAAGDFRAKLSAVLGEADETSPATKIFKEMQVARSPSAGSFFVDDEEIGNDWIRIEDVPRIARATQEGGGYGRPDSPAPRIVRGPRPAAPRAVKRNGSPQAKPGAPARPTRSRTPKG